MYPYGNPGLFARGLRLTRGINWGSLLDGTQKTLGVINQAIPIVYQVKPIINNAKTMFRIASQMASSDNNNTNINRINTINTNSNSNQNQNQVQTQTQTSINSSINRPIFYI